MHFTGEGIGHISTRGATRIFEDEIQSLWGLARVEEHADDIDDSDVDGDEDDLDQKGEFDPKDAFTSEESEMEEEEGWYTDRESDGVKNDLADDGDFVKDESALGYDMF